MDAEAQRIQEERKEYVKNIGIEYRFGCYEVIQPLYHSLVGILAH